MASDNLERITTRFQVHQPSGVCKTSTTISLFLLSLWVPTAVCSLICGSTIFRRRFSKIKKQPDEDAEYTNRFYVFASLFGSFFFQAIVWTILQAQLLADDDPDNQISDLYWVWLIRPLPATFVLFMAYICPSLYLENALEMQFVEGILGMFTIGIFDHIRKAVKGSGNLATDTAHDGDLRSGLQHISDGANLGLAFWILSFLVALGIIIIVIVVVVAREKPLDSTPLLLWTGWAIIFNLVRMIAGFLVWGGVALVDDRAFCPNLAATGGIAALSFASTLVDHGWRAFFFVEASRFFKSISSVARAPLLHAYRQAPTDEETRETAT